MHLKELQNELAQIQVTPSKVLGQNFLHDANLARWIVSRLEAEQKATVVEIGPGLGALTRELTSAGYRVLAIERDRKLAGYIERSYSSAQVDAKRAVEVVAEDAARFDIRLLWPRGIRSLIGNLPYSAAAPILFNFLQPASPIQKAVIMVQSEMGERLTAKPGSPESGSASVILQRLWHITTLKSVSPSVFYPRPRVDSVVLLFTRRERNNAWPPCEAANYEDLVRLGFSQRRKQLGNLLKHTLSDWPRVSSALDIPQKARAEELEIPQWIALSNHVSGWHQASAQSPYTEVFDVVDENDVVQSQATRAAVHAWGLLHRAVHIFVCNSKGELFLQKRSDFKDLHPGVWDSSSSGHLDAGESYDSAAARELTEELGISATPTLIARINASEQTGWEFVQVYRANHDGPFRLPPAEIETGCFFPLGMIDRWMAEHPGDFAPGFLACYAAVCGQLQSSPPDHAC